MGAFVAIFNTESETDMKMYESPTYGTSGYYASIVNRNRNAGTSSQVFVYTSSTISGVGTLLLNRHWGSGNQIGGEHRGTNEFLLKQNEKYLVRVNNAAGGNNQINTEFEWYEHTNLN